MEERLHLLGRPRWGRHGLGADKTHLLLYYLAHREDWLSREETAFLFWPDSDDLQARRNLRQLTYRLKRSFVGELLETKSDQLRFGGTSDVALLRSAVAAGRWAQAVALYEGRFLEGVMARDAAGFEAWLELERESLHALWREAALACATELERAQRYGEAAALLRQVWNYDRLDEPVLQALLSSSHLAGNREQALQAYRDFEELVRTELDLDPLEVTKRMIAAVKDGSLGEGESGRAPEAELPGVSTPFLGRQKELAEVDALLARDDCRLLVISGPGGVGKSRLALEVAQARAARHANGSRFVPLEGVASVDTVPAAVAEALGVTLYGTREARSQLLDYLRDKDLLLVADGLEHILEASALFSELLAGAPGLRVVITSREQPALSPAWQYRLPGLPYPQTKTPTTGKPLPRAPSSESILASDAAKLFIQSARRTNPGFEPSSEEAMPLLEICHLTEGLPLALELASAWIRHLSLQEIAQEVREGLELLDPGPGRGDGEDRGIRSVFENSWQLLSPAEQDVLARLSVFRGGFSREAAQQVAGASLYTLLSLVGKSLLVKDAVGRYDVHNLIRCYGSQKLLQSPAASRAEEQHATYYVQLAERSWPMLDQGKEREWLQLTGQEQANLRTAWEWGVRLERQDFIAPLIKPLAAYFSLRSLHREGLSYFAEAERTFVGAGPARARLLARMGNLRLKLEGPAAARGLLEEALQILERSDDAFEWAFTQMNLAAAERAEGDLGKAEERLKQGLSAFQRLDHRKAVVHTLFNLGSLARLRGATDEARALLEECLEAANDSQDLFASGYARMRLGDVLFESGDKAAAKRHFDESIADFDLLEHPTGSAGSLLGLARLARDSGDMRAATRLARAALEIYEDTGDRVGTCEALIELSRALHQSGDGRARANAARALDAAQEVSSEPLIVEALAALLVLVDAPTPEQVAALFVISEHSALPSRLGREVRGRVRRLVDELPRGTVEQANRRARSMSLSEVAEELKAASTG